MPIILATWVQSLKPALANSSQDPISKITKPKWTEDVAQAVKCMLYKHPVLSSNPSHTHTHTKKVRFERNSILTKSVFQTVDLDPLMNRLTFFQWSIPVETRREIIKVSTISGMYTQDVKCISYYGSQIKV
jgi:hypothetical protein